MFDRQGALLRPETPTSPSPKPEPTAASSFAIVINVYAKNTILEWFSASYRHISNVGFKQPTTRTGIEELILSPIYHKVILSKAEKYFNDAKREIYGPNQNSILRDNFDEMQKTYGSLVPCKFLNLLAQTVMEIFTLVFREAAKKLLPWRHPLRCREFFLSRAGSLYDELDPLNSIIPKLKRNLRKNKSCVSGLTCEFYKSQRFDFTIPPLPDKQLFSAPPLPPLINMNINISIQINDAGAF